MMFLDRILMVKRDEVEYWRLRRSVRDLKAQIRDALPVRDFLGAVKKGESQGGIRLIAEIKKASPSRGLIRRDFDPAAIAAAYEQGGAQALSVLTDEVFFQGHPDYLALARGAAGLPLLRKDFIISDYQVYESRTLGADAVLLIAAILAPSQLEEYLGLAGELGLCALVEVHTASEAILAPAAGARLVGINNRDLQSFKTDLETTFNLLPLIPAGTAVVSESGIRTHEQVMRLAAAGVDAVLVGEALMEQDDLAAAVRSLLTEKTDDDTDYDLREKQGE
jgi:indole-3-glycerol phosphate synthase